MIADTALEKILLSEFLKFGAKGYNCTYCFGKGRHETLEDPYTGRSRVRIEVLTRPAGGRGDSRLRAPQTVRQLSGGRLSSTPWQVDSRDTFY